MKPVFSNPALCLLLGLVTQHAGAAPSPTDATAASQRSVASLTVTSVTPDSFSVLDGELRAVVAGEVSAPPLGVNLFAYNAPDNKLKLSTHRIANGSFKVTTPIGINTLISNGVMTFFVSPSEDGSHQPSAPFTFGPNIVLPAPTITSAVGGRHRATVDGRALRNAHLQVTLAGTSKDVVAKGHDGNWHVTFEGVAEGSHQVSAKVVDATGTFPESAAAIADVVSEGDIIRPLQVTSPTPGFPVKRRFLVSGVASPHRGNVQVSLGQGPVVEASVGSANHHWSTLVTSPSHGSTPLLVRLPGTGESIGYDIDVAPFGDPVALRFVRHVDRVARRVRLIAEGTASLDGSDTVIRYLSNDAGWKTLSPIDEEGHWRYEGEFPTDMQLHGGRIDGVLYRDIAELNVPSLGDGQSESVSVPLLRAAPELTSPLRVGTQAMLSGIDHSGALRDVKITLADGRIFHAAVEMDQRWSTVIGPLPIGRSVITLSKDVPDHSAPSFETSTYVLDVVETP